MEIVDGQVHVGPVNVARRIGRAPGIPGTERGALSVEEALVAMDAVGVHAAVVDVWDGIVHKPGPQEYGAEVARRHPRRIATMRWIDHLAADVEEQVAAARAA